MSEKTDSKDKDIAYELTEFIAEIVVVPSGAGIRLSIYQEIKEAIKQAKKEVFDDIEKFSDNYKNDGFNRRHMKEEKFQYLKKKHLKQ